MCTPAQILTCPNTLLGTGTKDPVTGMFSLPVSPPLIPGHFVYCADACNDPGFMVSPDVVVQPAPAAPVLSPHMIILLVGVLGLVGLIGLARLRLSR